MFETGNKLATGGTRKDSGRPPGWHKDLCDSLINKYGLTERLAKIAAGQEVFSRTMVVKVGDSTKIKKVKYAASDSVQVYAYEKLADRAWGKPITPDEKSDGPNKNQNLYLFMVNFFQIIGKLSHDPKLQPQLRAALESAQVMAFAESVPDQEQTKTARQSPSQ